MQTREASDGIPLQVPCGSSLLLLYCHVYPVLDQEGHQDVEGGCCVLPVLYLSGPGQVAILCPPSVVDFEDSHTSKSSFT